MAMSSPNGENSWETQQKMCFNQENPLVSTDPTSRRAVKPTIDCMNGH
jgi:hypothetical protein